jgi:deoxyribodipyrimidine photolyase-related protein
MKTLRLILGDQLNIRHSWFRENNDQVIYLMAELGQEATYVRHHIQKVAGFFSAMRTFAHELREQGHKVIYYTLDAPENEGSLTELLDKVISEEHIQRFEYQMPDEYRLDEQLTKFCHGLELATQAVDSEHFLTDRGELEDFFRGKKQHLMESFYRYMRKKHQVLMLGDKEPMGGKWNFDKQNRNKWKGQQAVPPLPDQSKDVTEIAAMIDSCEVSTIGTLDPSSFNWPTSRREALDLLEYFCEWLLPCFGTYQDAMHTDQPFLFHSRLSFALNCKLISPKEVIDQVVDHWEASNGQIDLAQVEGFVRQILGWREYMRGMYWKFMPEFSKENFFDHQNPLPEFFWTAKTKMNCLSHAIGQSLDHAYAHHIQRLMVTGNFALLTGIEPSELDRWYLGIYIDAIEWVEITNTRGMSQYADGGRIATKPYISSGSYIDKMSNYCGSCHYEVKEKIGEKACPFNSLYWNFLATHRERLQDNRRMGMMYSVLNKMDPDQLAAMQDRAERIIANPDHF